MARDDAFWLDLALESGDGSHAWDIWSSAAEAALADAYRFSGGPVPERGLVLGGGAFLARTVRLGGPKVRKASRNSADPIEGGDVFMHHDASTAVLLDLRRRLEAVGDVLHAVIRDGVTLARSLEPTVQWDGILRIGPVHPLTLLDFELARRGGLGEWSQVVQELHLSLSDFIHRVVLHRRDEAIREWRNWLREDPLVHPYKWLRADLVPPALFFFSVILSSLLAVLGFWRILLGLMRNSVKLGFPNFAALGKGRIVLRNSLVRLMGGSLFCPSFPCLVFLVRCLLMLFGERALLLVVLMAGVGGSLRFSLYPGLMVLLVFSLSLRILGFGLRDCLKLILL